MLKVWIPGIKDQNDYGLNNYPWTSTATTDADGKLGGCLSFGNNKYMITNNKIFTSTQWSFAAWAYTTTKSGVSSSSSSQFLLCNRTSMGTGISIILTNTGKIRIDPMINSDTYQRYMDYTYPLNTWFHIAVTGNDGDINCYIDGTLINNFQITSTISNLSNYTFIGASAIGSTTINNFMVGKMNDVRVYDHALSPKEIAEIAKGLVVHYTLSGFGQDNLVKTSSPIYNLSTSMERIDNGVATKGVNSDTYFKLALNSTLVADTTYTLSFYATELPSGSVLRFGLGGQNNTYDTYCGDVSVHGGLNVFTFTPSKNISTAIIMDDQVRTGLPVVRMTYFKIEEGSKPTPWLPNSADPLYSAMGLNDNTEHDVSGYGNDGTKHNTIMFTPDTPRYLTSSIFNGSEYINKTGGLPAETKTISLWIKTSWDTLASSTYQIAAYDKNTQLIIGFYLDRICAYIRISGSSNGSSVYKGDLWKSNDWNHIVVVKTGSTTRDIYINGQKGTAASSTYFGSSTPTDLYIGCRNTSSIRDFLDGQLCDFRAYVTQLTQDQILELYQTGQSLSNNGTLFGYELIEDGGG